MRHRSGPADQPGRPCETAGSRTPREDAMENIMNASYRARLLLPIAALFAVCAAQTAAAEPTPDQAAQWLAQKLAESQNTHHKTDWDGKPAKFEQKVELSTIRISIQGRLSSSTEDPHDYHHTARFNNLIFPVSISSKNERWPSRLKLSCSGNHACITRFVSSSDVATRQDQVRHLILFVSTDEMAARIAKALNYLVREAGGTPTAKDDLF